MILSLTTVALAQNGTKDHEPSVQCPPPFHGHPVGHHDPEAGHAAHLHVGVDDDRNGDGTICGFRVGRDDNVHVHIDNNVRER